MRLRGVDKATKERQRVKDRVDWPVPTIDKLTEIVHLHIQNDIIAMLMDGKKETDVRKYLQTKYGISDLTAQLRFQEGISQLNRRKDWELDNIINLHLNRYEELYELLLVIDSVKDAAGCLRAKEKLLQFHKQNTHLKVINNIITQVTVRDQVDTFDVEKLNDEERDRLEFLTNKVSLNQ